MEFYTVNNVSTGVVFSSGIDIDIMVNIYKQLGKSENFKTVEDISEYELVYLSQGKFSSQEGLAFIGKVKKQQFALVQPNNVFNIEHESTVLFCKIHYGKLVLAHSSKALEQQTQQPNFSGLTDNEKKAHAWLESGKTGLSSLAMCKHLLPNLEHHRLKEDVNQSEPHYPRDADDFKRCLFLLESIPELRNNLKELINLSPKWEKLVNNWDQIEILVKTNNRDDAYSLIQTCITSGTKPKI